MIDVLSLFSVHSVYMPSRFYGFCWFVVPQIANATYHRYLTNNFLPKIVKDFVLETTSIKHAKIKPSVIETQELCFEITRVFQRRQPHFTVLKRIIYVCQFKSIQLVLFLDLYITSAICAWCYSILHIVIRQLASRHLSASVSLLVAHLYSTFIQRLQCFDAVGWVSGRASGP